MSRLSLVFAFLLCGALVAATETCSCANVGTAPSCTGSASGTQFTLTCTFYYQADRLFFLSAEGLKSETMMTHGRVSQVANFVGTCPKPNLYATNAPWTLSYDNSACSVTATLVLSPASVPTNWLFDNSSNAIAQATDATYNTYTIPVTTSVALQFAPGEYTVDNHLFTFYARLPLNTNTASATRYALKMFKLSDNMRSANLAFSAIAKGGLASNHYLTNPLFSGSVPLTCSVHDYVIVDCAPFWDTGASPTPVSGTLTATAQCGTGGCIPRDLTLQVSFNAGDAETTLTGQWSQLSFLIWRRVGTNTPILTNDVIIATDTLVLSFVFPAGSVSTLQTLTLHTTGISGVGSAAVTNVIDYPVGLSDASTLILNQAHTAAEFASTFAFPAGYESINFAVQFASVVPNDFRGAIDFLAAFQVTLAAAAPDVRRRDDDLADPHVYIVKNTQSGNANGEVTGDIETIIESSGAAHVMISFITLFVMIAVFWM